MKALDDWRQRAIKSSTVAYEEIIYQHIGLPHPDKAMGDKRWCHFLGTFTPSDMETLIIKLTNERASAINAMIEEVVMDPASRYLVPDMFRHEGTQEHGEEAHESHGDYLLRLNFQFFTYRDYLKRAERGARTVPREVTGHDWRRGKNPFYRRTVKIMPGPDEHFSILAKRFGYQYTPDLNGYLAYLLNHRPTRSFAEFLIGRFPMLLPEGDRQKHTYVTGATGSGKTELLKLLIHSQIRWGKGAVIIIDPHGTMSGQIARWPIFAPGGEAADRLAYIDPVLASDKTPVLNPFDLHPKATDADRERMTLQCVTAFEEMLRNEDGAALSANMRMLLEHCVSALMHMKSSSLLDLLDFVDGRRSQELARRAADVLGPLEASFFEGSFQSSDMAATRKAVANRLRRILRSGWKLFSGRSTIDLERAVRDKKVVVFNLSRGKMGAEVSEAFGRFVMAQLQGMALRREMLPDHARSPVHVFVDEAQNYISSATVSLLEEARKYRVFLTLAQQSAGRGMSAEIRKAVLANTWLKFTGANAEDTYRAIAGASKATMDDLAKIGNHNFLMTAGGRPPVRLFVASDLIDDSQKMTDGEWQAVRDSQIKRYYRPLARQDRRSEDSAADGEADATSRNSGPTKRRSKGKGQGNWKPKYDL